MTNFSPIVLQQWVQPFEAGETIFDDATFRLAVDDKLERGKRIQILARPDRTVVLATGEVVALPGVRDATTEAAIRDALATASLTLNGPDHLFFLTEQAKRDLLTQPDGPQIRVLNADDATIFGAFEDIVPDDDLDEAWVELDHWLVVGAVDGSALVAAGSAYPYGDDVPLADIGVVTDPKFRGRGYARNVVRKLVREIVERGYEPQFRCQTTNTASAALARSCGFTPLGTWDVPLPEDGS